MVDAKKPFYLFKNRSKYSEAPKSELVWILAQRIQFGFRHCTSPNFRISERQIIHKLNKIRVFFTSQDRFIFLKKIMYMKWFRIVRSDFRWQQISDFGCLKTKSSRVRIFGRSDFGIPLHKKYISSSIFDTIGSQN